MSSAFRNFFITFAIFLLIFGLVGWKLVYPAVADLVGLTGPGGIESGDESGDESEDTTSPGPINPNDDGDTFTAVIVGRAPDGLVASVIYLRINENTKRFTYCFIPPETQVGNSVGVDVPLKYLLPQLTGNDIMRKVSALTGMKVDYYINLGPEELEAVVSRLNEGKVFYSREIKFINPDFAELYDALSPGEPVPEEYYIVIPQGNNEMTTDLVHNIMIYNPRTDGTEYHVLIKELYEEVFLQFFVDSGTKKNSSALFSLLNEVETNITPAVLDEYMDLIFTYDIYTLKQITYPSHSDWTKAVNLFKDAG